MLKLSALVLHPVWRMCTCMGDGSFRCSSYLYPQGPGSFPYVFFITIHLSTLVTVDDNTFGVLILYFIYGPFRVFALYKGLHEVFQLLIKKLWCGTYSVGPMGKDTNDTVLTS